MFTEAGHLTGDRNADFGTSHDLGSTAKAFKLLIPALKQHLEANDSRTWMLTDRGDLTACGGNDVKYIFRHPCRAHRRRQSVSAAKNERPMNIQTAGNGGRVGNTGILRVSPGVTDTVCGLRSTKKPSLTRLSGESFKPTT